MLTQNQAFEAELRKIVDLEIAHLTDALINPLAVVDFADYRLRVGAIAGLKRIADMCDEANTILAAKT